MSLKIPAILVVILTVSTAEESSRWARSLQPGAPQINNKDQPWQLDPHIGRDDRGNTQTDVNIKHHGENHDIDAGWSKVVRGPDKAKPTWHVEGTYRWRRSLQPGAPQINNKDQPWQLDPHIGRDDKGNTQTDVNIKHHGDNHDLDAGWSKVVRGPNKAKPTWHVGGTYRWRRSLQPGAPQINNRDQPWQLDPHIGRDDKGNTKTDVNIKHHSENHDFDAGWSKVVRGPNKAKPSWHVGGTYRWRRAVEPDVPAANIDEDIYENIENAEHKEEAGDDYFLRLKRSAEESSNEDDDDKEEEPWILNPTLGRGDDGNTVAGVTLKRLDDNHDVEASWSKVVDGSGRAKPT